MEHKVDQSLGRQLGIPCVSRLFERYHVVCQKYITRQWEDCLSYTGKFVEAAIRCLLYHVEGTVHEKISVGSEIERLANLPSEAYDPSIRVHVPRVCRALYDLRNNWGGGHDNLEVNPVAMDAQFAFAGVRWLMLELLRRFSDLDPSDVQALVNAFHLPRFLMQEIDNDLIFLDNSLTIKDAVVLVAAYRFPDRVEQREFVQSITWRADGSIQNELVRMVKDGYLHRKSNGYLATQKALMEEHKILERYYEF